MTRRGVQLAHVISFIALTCAVIVAVPRPAAGAFGFITTWGSAGSGNGQFNEPVGVAADSDGNVYVADLYNNRVQKFTPEGAFLTAWGSSGGGPGQFYYPHAVATDRNTDHVYVVDLFNNRVQKFDANGNFVLAWGSYGSANGQFFEPRGVATDGNGYVYVADSQNSRIQKFTSNGTFVTSWGGFGSGNGQFQFAYAVATDGLSNVYVADINNHRVQKFDAAGNFLAAFGSQGSGPGQFGSLRGVATDPGGDVYAVDLGNHRVQVFSSSGVFLSTFGMFGSAPGQFNNPESVAVDGTGTVYIGDWGNQRIQRFGEVDATAPTVTVEQAVTQADPTNTSPVHFTVVFSEAVTDFTDGDVTLGGTAGATTAIVTGSGTSYDVAVSGMTASGTVVASVGSNAAHDGAGNPNAASISADNTLIYDVTAPLISVPGPIASTATGPNGALVSYSVSAVDNDGTTLIATCTPASGSTFPVGTTTVDCGASDAAGNPATASFTVIVTEAVTDVATQLADLRVSVQGLGPARSLEAKVRAAQEAYADGRTDDACSALTALAGEVKAQQGKKLTVAQAEQLLADSTRIRSLLGCR